MFVYSLSLNDGSNEKWIEDSHVVNLMSWALQSYYVYTYIEFLLSHQHCVVRTV